MKYNAEKIRALRATRGARLEDVAKVVGISAGYLSLIERGTKKSMSAKVAKVLADFYGVPFESFSDETPPQRNDGKEGEMNIVLFRRLRVEKGVSLSAVAKAVGIDKSTLSLIETGKRMAPHYDTVVKLAKYYGVDPDTLMKPKTGQKEIPDLTRFLWEHPQFTFEGELVDIGSEGETERLMMAIRMGIVWAKHK